MPQNSVEDPDGITEPELGYKHVRGDVIYKDSRKLVQVGNSVGVTLPKKMLDLLFETRIGIQVDQEVMQQRNGLTKIILTLKKTKLGVELPKTGGTPQENRKEGEERGREV